jgi:transcriptional/translational regulatory protein YebC/TACO1
MTHFKPERELTQQEDKALRKLKDMLEEIDDIKKSAGRETGP